MRSLTGLTLLFAAACATAVECETPALERARFALDIADREPVGAEPQILPHSSPTLYFFVEVLGGEGRTVQHRWYADEKQVADVALRIGGNRWRTWSSKQLGESDARTWRVVVETPDGCVLGEKSVAIGVNVPAIDEAQALLEKGDVTGARLVLKEAQQRRPDLHPLLQSFLARDVTLAQAGKEIDEDQLYIAASRLDELGQRDDLSVELKQRLETLQRRLEQRRRQLDRDMALALTTWKKLQSHTLNGGNCPADSAAVAAQLQLIPGGRHLLVGDQVRTEGMVEVGVMDQRTGTLHHLLLECPLLPGMD